MSPSGPHRYILQRRAVVVAIGVEADMTLWAEFDDLVAIDPSRKSEFIQVRSDGLSCVLAARHRENLKS